MPAPTALKAEGPPPKDIPLPDVAHDEDLLLEEPVQEEKPAQGEDTEMKMTEEDQHIFPAAKDIGTVTRRETRKVGIPPHRMSP
jgi:RNA-binding protein PNO1